METEGLGAAIKEVERLTRESCKSQVLKVDAERPGVYFIIGPDGKATKHVADPAWHDEKLATPAELLAFVKDDGDAESSRIFLNEHQLVYMKDKQDRRHKATCDLIPTPQWLWLSKQSGIPMSQAEIVRLLRITLRQCLPSDSALLSLLRNLKFAAGQDGEMTVQHQRQSLSKQVVAEIQAERSLPEEIPLMVPVFENHPFAVRVVCAIEVLASDQKFKLTPYPLELRRGMDEALGSIESLFEDDELPRIFQGQP